METIYPSKLLLFGEHSVLKGSNALAIPFPHFQAKWKFDKFNFKEKQQKLPDLLAYLKQLQNGGKLLTNLDLDRFTDELSKGIYFASSIPTGYGLGSSGALCAAIYHRYGPDYKNSSLNNLKAQLAQIESFFHGSSSGIDPLIIYLRKGILIHSSKGIESIPDAKMPSFESTDFFYFILDTHTERKTAPLVNWFLSQCEVPSFHKLVTEELNHYIDDIISAFLSGNYKSVFKNFEKISRFQFEHLAQLIPTNSLKLWEASLHQNDISIKLCGAGGGGFLLGMAKKEAMESPWFQELDTIIIS
ncbi:MAG: mevalonate kinase [Bacteroidota bacterium]